MGDVANNANAKNVPIRLCYHRGCHYNSLVDPHTATIGVGLGLPNHNPGAADRNLVGQAVRQSEQDVVEKTMLEDKIKATGINCYQMNFYQVHPIRINLICIKKLI